MLAKLLLVARTMAKSMGRLSMDRESPNGNGNINIGHVFLVPAVVRWIRESPWNVLPFRSARINGDNADLRGPHEAALICADIANLQQICADQCISVYAHICTNYCRSAEDLQKIAQICRDLRRLTQICCRYGQICGDLHRSAQHQGSHRQTFSWCATEHYKTK